ncbi:hypothetical protein OG568_47580 [Streptomyces sp. NBC_01450]|uniref:hypothetical protein n=1 Tax=Streptomyces sp. NBC_01450 TaxID=2903871 RepID=UPI002E30714E|nr:hypothetical protein [Streptomyces sp. NBC_01450]
MRSPFTAAGAVERRTARGLALGLTALLLAVAALVGLPRPAQAASAGVAVYPVASIYPASTDYTLTVNGTSVPVTKYPGYDIAQLALGTGTATMAVTKTNHTDIGSYSISPRKLNLSGSVSGSTLTFTVRHDDYLIVKLDGRPNLVIAADPAESDRPSTSGTGIFNVRSTPYNVQPNTGDYSTTAVQRALDDAAAWGSANGGQGIVYVPAGVYTLGNLYLRSNRTTARSRSRRRHVPLKRRSPARRRASPVVGAAGGGGRHPVSTRARSRRCRTAGPAGTARAEPVPTLGPAEQ